MPPTIIARIGAPYDRARALFFALNIAQSAGALTGTTRVSACSFTRRSPVRFSTTTNDVYFEDTPCSFASATMRSFIVSARRPESAARSRSRIRACAQSLVTAGRSSRSGRSIGTSR